MFDEMLTAGASAANLRYKYPCGMGADDSIKYMRFCLQVRQIRYRGEQLLTERIRNDEHYIECTTVAARGGHPEVEIIVLSMKEHCAPASMIIVLLEDIFFSPFVHSHIDYKPHVDDIRIE